MVSQNDSQAHPQGSKSCGSMWEMSASSRSLTSMKDAHCSSSVSTLTPASSNTCMGGLATYPVSITPSTGVNIMTILEHTQQPHSWYGLHRVLPAPSDDLESGEEELEWEGEGEKDAILHLARCIESLG